MDLSIKVIIKMELSLVKELTLLRKMENIKYQLLQLENKVCIITGAASLRSIGYGTAELFAAHGAKLVILDLAMDDQIASQLTNHIETQIYCVNSINIFKEILNDKKTPLLKYLILDLYAYYRKQRLTFYKYIFSI